MTYVLAVDVDGVCADLHTEWVKRYNRDYDDDLKVSDITGWHMHEFVKCGKDIYKYIEDQYIYDCVLPMPGALSAIQTIKSAGVRVVYATSPTAGTMGRKYRWLLDHGFIDALDDYIEVSDKSLVCANGLVDDYHVNIVGFRGEKYLFDAPWNRGITLQNMTRVYLDWTWIILNLERMK